MEQRAEQPVVLTVKADGTCYITEAGFPCAALADKLPAVFEQRADKSLFVRGDEDTPYGKLMAVLAAGRKSGVLTVGLVTDPASEEPAQ
jgi:biopolymer transport protein TolR